MHKQFETTLKRRSHRERYYSSMNYEQYFQIYGPPAPLVKPMEDPPEQMPLFSLEEPSTASKDDAAGLPLLTLADCKMETILEIEGSQNFTQKLHKSPRVNFLNSHIKARNSFSLTGEQEEEEPQPPKRMRVRMRSQSDSSQYLIFNFLQRANQTGRKRIKLQ